MGQFTFSKAERLKSEKDIQELFAKGSSFYLFPFKVLLQKSPSPAQSNRILISVSKRNFSKAVHRNLLKRRIREAYRLEKNKLKLVVTHHIGLIYTHKEIMPFSEISEKMVHVIKRITKMSPAEMKTQ